MKMCGLSYETSLAKDINFTNNFMDAKKGLLVENKANISHFKNMVSA